MKIRYHIEVWENVSNDRNEHVCFVGSWKTEEEALKYIEGRTERDEKDPSLTGYWYKIVKSYTNSKNESWLRPANKQHL